MFSLLLYIPVCFLFKFLPDLPVLLQLRIYIVIELPSLRIVDLRFTLSYSRLTPMQYYSTNPKINER